MNREKPNDPFTDLALGILLGAAALAGILWAAGAASARLSGNGVPRHQPFGGLAAFAHFTDPSAAWHSPVGPPAIYWTITGTAILLLAVLVWLGVWLWQHERSGADTAKYPEQIEGLADRREVKASAGPKTLLAQAGTLRPSVTEPTPRDVGWQLGTAAGPAAGWESGTRWSCSARQAQAKVSTSSSPQSSTPPAR